MCYIWLWNYSDAEKRAASTGRVGFVWCSLRDGYINPGPRGVKVPENGVGDGAAVRAKLSFLNG